MDGSIDCHTEWSKVRQRSTNIVWYRLYVESKKKDTNESKKDTNEFIYKTETES